jgi:hypothetical protein
MSPEQVAKLLHDRLNAKKKEPLPEQKCAQCRGPFTPKRAWQKFCSDSCASFHSNNQRNIRLGLLEKKAHDLEKQVEALQTENESLKLEIKRLS